MLFRCSIVIAAIAAALALCLVAVGYQPVPPQGDKPTQAATVKLLDQGRGDLVPLRWEPQPGVPVRGKMTMHMGMSMRIDGMAIPSVDLPAFVFTIAATAGEPDANGLYQVETVYEDISLEGETEPMIRRMMMDMLEGMKGAKMTYRMDTRGMVSDTNLEDFPAEILQMMGGEQGMRGMVESMSHPMPLEPVGIGARWEVVQEMQAPNAPKISNTLVYELVRRNGNAIEVSITGTQTGKEQEFDVGVPGAKAVLKNAEGTVRGSAYMRLNRLLPNSATSEGSMSFLMEVTENGVTQTLEQTVTTDFEIEYLDEAGVKPVDAGSAG